MPSGMNSKCQKPVNSYQTDPLQYIDKLVNAYSGQFDNFTKFHMFNPRSINHIYIKKSLVTTNTLL